MKPHLPLPGRGRKKDSDRKNGKRPRIDFQRAGLAVATVAILSVLLCIHLLPEKVSLELNDLAPQDVHADRTVRYKDVYELKKQQELAASAVGRVYDRNAYALTQASKELGALFQGLESARNDQSMTTAHQKAVAARSQAKDLGVDLPLQMTTALMLAPSSSFVEIRDTTNQIVRNTMKGEIRDYPDEMPKVLERISADAETALGSTEYATAVVDIARALVRPNMVFNLEKTASEQQRAKDLVQAKTHYIRAGDLIISKGEIVRPEHIQKLDALGLMQRRIDFRIAMLLTTLVSFLVGLVIIYLARYQSDIYKSTRLLLLLSLVVTLSTLGLGLSKGLLTVDLPGLHSAHIGILFTTTAGMLLATLLNPQVAVLIVAMLSMATGLVMNNELRYATSTLISGLVAIYAVASIRGRTDQMRTTGVIAITNIATVWIMGGLFHDTLADMAFGSLWAVIIALLATWIFWHVAWAMERPFKVTTHISLLELADTNRPILRRLVVEAPGTYTHSMAVGHLAEAAAAAIGADALFARVASYYHDIGKIRRPHFFVENQGVENAHDRLNPTLSALVITSHIKDGLEVARESKLPPSLQEIIIQHHGTSLVQYFYSQVSEQLEPSSLLEQQFRYDGPKPRSKEAAVVMLADSVEAASRALTKPTIIQLETLVHKIIQDKLQDSQLDQSELTFRDIGIIKEAFARTLKGTLHARIEYPDGPAENGKVSEDGDSDQELAASTDTSGEADTNSGESIKS